MKVSRNTAKPKNKGGRPRGSSPTSGGFKSGPDPRRNTHGQKNKAAVQVTKSFREILTLILNREETHDIGKQKITKKNLMWIGERLVNMAKQGNVRAIEMVLERTEGKVADKLNIDANISPIEIVKFEYPYCSLDELTKQNS